jgi:CubicO group peptidase (beta-lactamase class C family)
MKSALDRRRLIAGASAVLATAPWASTFATPGQVDFAQRLALVSGSDKLEGLHALLVSQRGATIFEHYQPGRDEERTSGDLGIVQFGPDMPHDLRSVSKGVVGLLYGIALAEGKVPAPDARLYAQFPEYADLARQNGRDRITIAHVLSMTTGFEWDELTYPYGDPRNSETRMDAESDRFRYILSLPIAEEPGKKWTYFGGATALLGRLIERGTGQPLLDYARRVLFGPMGFGPSTWAKDASGEPIAASGLRLLPRDMLKLGELILGNGEWQGRRLVPADWMQAATTPVVMISETRSYGYHWYMGEVAAAGQTRKHHWIGGFGWGGQRLFAFPDLGLAVAMNCGLYGKSGQEQGRVTNTIVLAVVLPLAS